MYKPLPFSDSNIANFCSIIDKSDWRSTHVKQLHKGTCAMKTKFGVDVCKTVVLKT